MNKYIFSATLIIALFRKFIKIIPVINQLLYKLNYKLAMALIKPSVIRK